MEPDDNQERPFSDAGQHSERVDQGENKLRPSPTFPAILMRLRLGHPPLSDKVQEHELISALSSSEWPVRVGAVQAMGELRERAPLGLLVSALKDEHESVRAAAAHALGKLGERASLEPLVAALHDPTWLVRAAAAQALGKLSERAPIEPLVAALRDEDESVRAAATQALGAMGERAPTEPLLVALHDPAWHVREVAVLALGGLGERTPVAAVLAALQDEDESVREAVKFLQERYPERFAPNPSSTTEPLSQPNLDIASKLQGQGFLELPEQTVKVEGQEKLNGHFNMTLDSGQATLSLQQGYPRHGMLRLLRLVLLYCWSVFIVLLGSLVWNLYQLTSANPAKLTDQVAYQALINSLGPLASSGIPSWLRLATMVLFLMLLFGCVWASRDVRQEKNRMQMRAARLERDEDILESDSGTRRVIPASSRHGPDRVKPVLTRRAVLVGLATVAIAGNGIAWYLLLRSKQGSQVASLADLEKPLYIYRGQSDGVYSLAFAPYGTRVASGAGDIYHQANKDYTVQVWDAASANNVQIYRGHTDTVRGVAWSPGGTRIASASDDQTVRVWETSTGKLLYIYQGHTYPVLSVAWSPDATHIASGSRDGTVHLWEPVSGSKPSVYQIHTGDVNTVAWFPDGVSIVSGSSDNTVRVWAVATGRPSLTYLGFEGWGAISGALSPDGTLIASIVNTAYSNGIDTTSSNTFARKLEVWNALSGRKVSAYTGHQARVTAAVWSSDSKHLASASDDETVQVWEASTGKHIFTYVASANLGAGLAWSPDGRLIVAGDIYDGSVRVWRAP